MAWQCWLRRLFGPQRGRDVGRKQTKSNQLQGRIQRPSPQGQMSPRHHRAKRRACYRSEKASGLTNQASTPTRRPEYSHSNYCKNPAGPQAKKKLAWRLGRAAARKCHQGDHGDRAIQPLHDSERSGTDQPLRPVPAAQQRLEVRQHRLKTLVSPSGEGAPAASSANPGRQQVVDDGAATVLRPPRSSMNPKRRRTSM